MEIKGSAIRTIPEFIKAKFPEKYDAWFSLLPPASAAIFSGFIKPSDWYDLHDAAIVPTEIHYLEVKFIFIIYALSFIPNL